jgi:HD-like signal output (HDOD) protein
MNAAVLDMIKKSAAVPSMPQLVLRFIEVMQDPEFEYEDLAGVMAADPGTVSEVLRLCNSALFGVRQKVASLRQALTLLGPTRTRSLLLGRYLVDTVSQKRAGGLDMAYVWRRSLAGAVVASRLAELTGIRESDEVFIAALLADIGIPILAETFPDRYAPIVERIRPNGKPFTPEEERRAVEATHGEVSAMVLAHWTLPDLVCQAVNLHQSPKPGNGPHAVFARLIHAGDDIARTLCETAEAEAVVSNCRKAAEFSGVEVERLIDVLSYAEDNILELARVLRIDVIPAKSYAYVIRTLREKLSVSAGA